MSRKSNLIHAVTQALKSSNKGAHATRKTQLTTMRLIIEDLSILHCAPQRWQELTDSQIIRVIGYWRSKQIKTETIAKRISILRKISILLGQKQFFPSNKELGLQLQAPKKADRILSDNILEQIVHPITKSIIEHEICFGLTKSEAIKLSEHSIANDQITIYRDIAYNHYDRIIPVLTQKQHEALISRRKVIKNYRGQDSLLQIASFPKISSLYRSELAILKINGHSHFREIYAKDRFKNLAVSNTKADSIAILQKELGLSSSRLLLRWIK